MSSTLIRVVADVMTVHRVVTPHFLYLFTRGRTLGGSHLFASASDPTMNTAGRDVSETLASFPPALRLTDQMTALF